MGATAGHRSVGIVVTATRWPSGELVREADAAMYEAKKAGRDCYRADDRLSPARGDEQPSR